MSARLLCVLLLATGCGDACGRKSAPAPTSDDPFELPATAPAALASPDAGGLPCFTVRAADNTPGAKAVFVAHKVEGNGPTWAGILNALVRQHGKVGDAVAPGTPGVPRFGFAQWLDTDAGRTWFLVDDEADDVVFCSGDPKFLALMDQLQRKVNAEPDALARVLSLVDPDDLE